MSHKPKPVEDHYKESFNVNVSSLSKHLASKLVPEQEIEDIMNSISSLYFGNVVKIVAECNKDLMLLEYVPSPLKLFIDCIAQSQQSKFFSCSSTILKGYVDALEDWM